MYKVYKKLPELQFFEKIRLYTKRYLCIKDLFTYFFRLKNEEKTQWCDWKYCVF